MSNLESAVASIKDQLGPRASTMAKPRYEDVNEDNKNIQVIKQNTGFHCFKCKKSVFPASFDTVTTKNNRQQFRANCTDCKGNMYKFGKGSRKT